MSKSSQDSNKVLNYKKYNREEKEDLIKDYLPLVKRVVHRLSARLPKDIDIKEMINSGIIGLVDAMEKYNPSHDTSFQTYAQFRIKGAILDSFRAQDWLPRSLRFKSHKLEEAYKTIDQKLGRSATDEEVARELGIEVSALQKALNQVGNIVMLSFEDLGFGHGEERFKGKECFSSTGVDPLSNLMGGEQINYIARALDRLPEKERLVISLYFYEELNLREIGEILGVTESRASQIRSRALIRLKLYLKNAMEELND